jgi:hypothetical protein
VILKGILAVRHWQLLNKERNKIEWYRRHDERNLPGNEGERDFTDQDYPGRGLEFEFWDIPN